MRLRNIAADRDGGLADDFDDDAVSDRLPSSAILISEGRPHGSATLGHLLGRGPLRSLPVRERYGALRSAHRSGATRERRRRMETLERQEMEARTAAYAARRTRRLRAPR